ncbi:MAG: methionine adenosyltransferase [Clostridia bacterium]|nr:methionine adenosyltransferase [Clostridia bacterium]
MVFVLFTSESVTEGHPDKMADQIADAVLDAVLAQDPDARAAIEAALTTGLVVVFGELSCECYVDIPAVVRQVVRDIGYTRAKYGFDADTCAVLTAIDEQSPDIAQGVIRAWEVREGRESDTLSSLGAGDQGIMFGFACDETETYMPLPIALAHGLTQRLSRARKEGALPYLLPDGKAQVTVEYGEDGRARRVDTVIVSTQHGPDVDRATLERDIRRHVVEPVVPASLWSQTTRLLVNPSGRFVIGGPHADSGLTGRKIIVDTYGGYARHGGGSFSGKDPTKVDRTAAYAARHAAKNIVAAGLARQCEVQVAYAIGVARPVCLQVDSRGTGRLPDADLTAIVRRLFDFRPAAIIERFQLRRPLYRQLAAYGHFGRPELDLPWERLDMVEPIVAEAHRLGYEPEAEDAPGPRLFAERASAKETDA